MPYTPSRCFHPIDAVYSYYTCARIGSDDIICIMIVMDLEWNSGNADGVSLAEILQIGAVKLDRKSHRIVDTFSVFVRPRVHAEFNLGSKTLPELKCSLESNTTFEEAYASFLDWAKGESAFAGWGAEDMQVLNANAAFYSLPEMQNTQMIDFQAAFSFTIGAPGPVALHKAVEFCQIPDCFDYHNALNDAMYTAIVSEWVDESALSIRLNTAHCMELLSKAFPVPPRKRSERMESVSAVLNNGAMRNIKCPVCGEVCRVWDWCSNDERRFYSVFRCHKHGRFLCRLTVTYDGELYRGCCSVPEVDMQELHYYQLAHQTKHYPCATTARRSKRRRKSRRRKNADAPSLAPLITDNEGA